MKLLGYSIFLLSLLSCIALAQPAKLNNDNQAVLIGPLLDEKVKKLLYEMDSFNNASLSASEIQKQFENLPGITNQLFEYLWFQLSLHSEENGYQADSSTVGNVLYGLRFRKDLTSSQIEQLANQMRDFARVEEKNGDLVRENFLSGGMIVLIKKPTKEIEDFILELLNDYDYDIQVNAAKALQEMGTEKSLGVLQEKLDQNGTNPPDYRTNELSRAIQKINTRRELLKTPSSTAIHHHHNTSQFNKPILNASTPSSSSSGDSSFSFWWILWAIAIVMVVRIMWKLIRTLYDSF